MEVDCNISSPIPMALDFLSSLYEAGLSYNSINTARCALFFILQLSVSEVTFGQSPIVKQFMKGIFELYPALSHYKVIGDLRKVLNFFS